MAKKSAAVACLLGVVPFVFLVTGASVFDVSKHSASVGAAETPATATADSISDPGQTKKDEVNRRENIGHYVISGIEFFADEPDVKELSKFFAENPDISQLKEIKNPRGRIFVMPSIAVIPCETTLINKDGDPVVDRADIRDDVVKSAQATAKRLSKPRIPKPETSDSHECENCGYQRPANNDGQTKLVAVPTDSADQIARPYLARVVCKLTCNELHPDTKLGVLSQLLNIDQNLNVTYRQMFETGFLFWSNGSIHVTRLPILEEWAKRYRFEVTAPSGVKVRIACNGKERGATFLASGAIMSTLSTIAVECPNLDAATARMMYDGHFSLIADMQVPLTRMQFAMGRYNMENFTSILAKQFARRDTTVNESSSGFLFWKSVDRSVSTFLTSNISVDATNRSVSSVNISIRDLDDPAIREAALNYIIPKRTASRADVRKLINDHIEAAAKAEEKHQTEAAEAHRKYAEYLIKVMEAKDDGESESKALAALAALAAAAATSGGSAAGSGAAAGAGAGVAGGGDALSALAQFFFLGISWSDSRGSDIFQIASTRTANWSETETRDFNALIANQITSSYVVNKSDFKELRDFASARSALIEEDVEPTCEKIIERIRETKAVQLSAVAPELSDSLQRDFPAVSDAIEKAAGEKAMPAHEKP